MILQEDSRIQLINQSKSTAKGKQRYLRRVKSKIATTVKQYNSIDMNKLFKSGIITVEISVKGETDTYEVKISFGGFLDILHDQLKARNDKFDLQTITKTLVVGFNRSDVYVHCTCPDARYRMAYWQTVNNINSGESENRPSNITNPNDTLGKGCKHILLVLSNTSWILKVASVINNYVKYMSQHQPKLYQTIIYPAIYGREYEEPVQLDIFDDDTLETNKDTLDVSNEFGRTSGQFKSGNKYRFLSQNKDKDQISIDDEE